MRSKQEMENHFLLAENEDDEQYSLYSHQKPASNLSRCSSRRLMYFLVLLLTHAGSIWLTYLYTTTKTTQAYSQDFKSTDKVFPGLDRSLSIVNFSNHHVNATSRWTAPPSKEVDHAWNELGIRDKGFLLPGDAGREYGLDPMRHVYAPKGTMLEGRDGFPVFIQGLHDLHCLNELRRALYYNKAYYRQFEDDTLTAEWFRISHINHCLDNVRERLMCTADVGLIPSVWTSRDENRPLFGSQHKCHNYDALIAWNTKWHDTKEELAVDWSVQLSAPDDAILYDIHESE